jgi:hypothetical protein
MDYEVWSFKIDGNWYRAEERGNDGIFSQKNRALLIAGNTSTEAGVVEVIVIERREIARYNGDSIGEKFRLNQDRKKTSTGDQPVEKEKKKEEESHAEVHGDRSKESDVPASGAEHVGEAASGGSEREGTPQG